MKRHLVSRTRHADDSEPDRTGGTMGSRPIRRPALIAATTAAVSLLGVVTVASSPWPSVTAAPPLPAVTPTNCEGAATSLVRTPDARCSSIDYLSLPTSPVPPSPCRNLIFGAARVLGGDPTGWVVSLIDGGGQVGQTIDQAIHDRLDMVRTIVMRTQSADPQRTVDLDALNALIADAASQPCSSAACSSIESDAVEIGSTADGAVATRSGWYWLCAPPPAGDVE